MLPGDRLHFLCRDIPVHTDIPARLRRLGIRTRYIHGYYAGNVTPERIAHLRSLIDPAIAANSDLSPRLMGLMFSQWFARFSTSPTLFLVGLAVVCGVYFIRMRPEEFILFSTGFTTMGAEILVVFAFQIYFGYVYLQIGLIVTVFLAGLLPGAWWAGRVRRRGSRFLILGDGLLILLTALFALGLWVIADRLPMGFFLVYGLLVSLVCGFQFPLALDAGGGDAPAATRAFSADLIGAAGGTLVTSALLVPHFGILGAAGGLMAVKTCSLLVGVHSHGKHLAS
jgi:spermidine synthase